MFGLKWLTPEMLAAAGLTAATAGAAAPAMAAAAGSAGAAGAAAGAAGAGSAGLLGAGAAATAATVAPAVAAAAPVATAATAAVPAAEAGLLGGAKALGTQAMGYLDTAGKALKPIGKAANTANAVSSMFPHSAPVQTPAPNFGNGAGSQVFSGLLQNQQVTDQARMQEEMQRRQAQQKLIGLIGGM